MTLSRRPPQADSQGEVRECDPGSALGVLLQVGRARAVQLLRWNLMRKGPADKRGGGGGGGGGRTHTPEMVTGWG